LPLRGVDVGASDPTTGHRPLALANVYVDLDTTSAVKTTAKDKKSRGGEPGLLEKDTRPLGALEATIANRHLVLLGIPGGGKSTFVSHLAHCLAMAALEPAANWLAHVPGWSPKEADALPILVFELRRAVQSAEPPGGGGLLVRSTGFYSLAD
jgi:hypothetical protein